MTDHIVPIQNEFSTCSGRTSQGETMKDHDIFQKTIEDLTVNDVYEMAASIGKDFEELRDLVGGTMLTEITPKIVRVLEMLESVSKPSENYSTNVIELQAAVQQLKLDGKSAAAKHNEDLETVKSAWRNETKQLLQSIDTLQEDNKMMVNLLAETADVSGSTTFVTEEQVYSANALKETNTKLRDEVREKTRVIDQQAAECEALLSQSDQLTKLNVNLRRRIVLMEKRSETIVKQCTDLESTCKEKDRQIKELHKRVGELNERLKSSTSPTTKVTQQRSPPMITPLTPDGPDPLLTNKLIIDLDDPNRPRYTMHELQEVLSERNCFKLKTILLEDELNYYKRFFKEERKDESWVELDDELVLATPHAHEVNNNNNTRREPIGESDNFIKKLFASIFLRNSRGAESPDPLQQPSLPSSLRYNPPMIDESDVMPTLNIQPSPEDELPPDFDGEMSAFGPLRFSSDESLEMT